MEHTVEKPLLSASELSESVMTAEREAERARALFAANLTTASHSGSLVLRRAVREARPLLLGAVVVAGLGVALVVKALAAPARRTIQWVRGPTLGQRIARVAVTSIASALLRRLAERAASRQLEVVETAARPGSEVPARSS
jgi:hypothetical protein